MRCVYFCRSSSIIDEDETETSQATLCPGGKHKLIWDEEIGLICLFYNQMQLEIKYVLPPFQQPSKVVHDCGKFIAEMERVVFRMVCEGYYVDNCYDRFQLVPPMILEVQEI